MLRLTCSRHSQPYSQSGSSDVASGYDFHIATGLFCCFNCAVYRAVLVACKLGIDIPSTSDCPQLTHTGSESEHALYIMAVADVLETRISTRARNHRII